MFKPRLRLSSGAGLLRACPAPARASSPFARAAAAAAASRHQSQAPVTAGPQQMAGLTDGAKFSAEGIFKLYTNNGFGVAWDLYQLWCIEMLNQEIAGTPLGSSKKSTLDIAKITSREAHLAPTFNYASMAHNNHFFFDSLRSHTPTEEQPDRVPYEHMPKQLKDLLEIDFGSLDTLRREMIEQADAMFGPGFVWLVRQTHIGKKQVRPFRILVTYQAGSPYPQAHWRQQSLDMNHQAGVSDRLGIATNNYFNQANTAVGRDPMHTDVIHTNMNDGQQAEESRFKTPGSARLTPVLCVNTWEHAWMYDWGVGNKRLYLEAWWNAIDWGKVAERVLDLDKELMSEDPKRIQTSQAAEANRGYA